MLLLVTVRVCASLNAYWCQAEELTEKIMDKAPAWAAVPPPAVRTVPISEFLWIPVVRLVCS